MDDSPDRIGPDTSPKKSMGSRVGDKGRSIARAFTTKDGLIGDYDYAFLFKPNLPFISKSRRAAPFFGLNDHMPVLLALLLGFQHALSMLAGVISPPIIIAGQGGANLEASQAQYLVSISLIVSLPPVRTGGWLTACLGLFPSFLKQSRLLYRQMLAYGFRVGTSFGIIPVATGALAQMYATGYCPTGPGGTKLPCPDGYGAILGTACLCALLEIGLSFTSPKYLKKFFPPIVTGPTVTLIGVNLIKSGFQNWAGGNGTCQTRPTSGPFMLCPSNSAPHALPWGSAEFVGLGFSVFLTIILCERFGAPIMKSTAVVIGLLVGCIIAAACGYFDRSGIDSAPAATFIWVHTFKLSVYGPIILPLLAVYIVLMMEAIGDISATCDVSRLEVEGKMFDSRIQGGVLADGFNGLLAGLCTITPMSTFAQNNGVIALTRCANRKAGYCCCFFLIIMGIFSKFAAALVAIPGAVLGGMTTFLFGAVAASGLRIISTVPFTRRNRFILTAALSIGFGAILVPNWFTYVFTYRGGNKGKQGFFNAIVLVMETGFAVTAFISIILNLLLEEEIEDEAASITANNADDAADEEEWKRIQGKKSSDIENGSSSKEGEMKTARM
ncbi:MAG: hypothetical protein M1836_006494 [Candelina mexicana]|nr:MAG: hypothetical protein M1836_006494 [Candelina mexicana]